MDPTLIPIRDIHELDPVGWWPPAIGWWVLAAVLLALTALAWRYRHRWLWWTGSWRTAARGELFALRGQMRRGDPKLLGQALSELLRRVAMARCGRAACAGLSGSQWLAWLEANDPKGFRWQEEGRLLLILPYAPPGAETDREHLDRLARALGHWLVKGCPLRPVTAGEA